VRTSWALTFFALLAKGAVLVVSDAFVLEKPKKRVFATMMSTAKPGELDATLRERRAVLEKKHGAPIALPPDLASAAKAWEAWWGKQAHCYAVKLERSCLTGSVPETIATPDRAEEAVMARRVGTVQRSSWRPWRACAQGAPGKARAQRPSRRPLRPRCAEVRLGLEEFKRSIDDYQRRGFERVRDPPPRACSAPPAHPSRARGAW
jgi:hypothetical protein